MHAWRAGQPAGFKCSWNVASHMHGHSSSKSGAQPALPGQAPCQRCGCANAPRLVLAPTLLVTSTVQDISTMSHISRRPQASR